MEPTAHLSPQKPQPQPEPQPEPQPQPEPEHEPARIAAPEEVRAAVEAQEIADYLQSLADCEAPSRTWEGWEADVKKAESYCKRGDAAYQRALGLPAGNDDRTKRLELAYTRFWQYANLIMVLRKDPKWSMYVRGEERRRTESQAYVCYDGAAQAPATGCKVQTNGVATLA